MDRLEATPIPGTDGAVAPFFSPDSLWIGFFAEGKLKKAPLGGGAIVTLCDSVDFYYGRIESSASWGMDDTIIFPGIRGLMRVSASGGTPKAITGIPTKQGELYYFSPQFLPGGKSVLFHIFSGSGFENMRVAAHALGTMERRILVEGGSQPRYASSGHLIYARGGSLMAAPFDADRLQVTGSPVPILHGVAYSEDGRADFSVSSDGSLVYVPAEDTPEMTVLWMDRQGEAQPIELPPHQYFAPSLSPDGRRLAMTTLDGPRMETWIFDIERNVLTRYTFEGSNHFSVWTPDGERLAFSSDRDGPHNIYWKPADGSGAAERLVVSDQHQDVGSWSPDGKILAFSEAGPGTNWDILLLYVDGERHVKPFLQTEFTEDHPMISPDGRWLAYRSNESGRFEIYVQPFPDGGRKLQISTEGGSDPRWARDGRELFYREGEKMMVVSVETGDEFTAERPRMLFTSDTEVAAGHGGPNFDITPDGRRFVMTRVKPQPPPTEIHVILNWFDELKRLVPPD
jgi:serine/threonine-protein kinase